MHLIILLVLIFNLITLNFCEGQEKIISHKISDYKFESVFGMTIKEPHNIYSLLGMGFFKTPRSDNSDSLIHDWIKNHNNANVVSISAMSPAHMDYPDSKMIYCWIIADKDTLNNFLVKNGCFPGGTMMRMKTLDEMEEWERKMYLDSDEKWEYEVLIEMDVYEKFIEQIKSAELYAKENELGIWNEGLKR